jgi:hypothetical protein
MNIPSRQYQLLAKAAPEPQRREMMDAYRKAHKLREPKAKRPRGMNKTEAEWGRKLHLRKLLGEIRNYRYIGHRRKLLCMASNRYYNPDFLVILKDGSREFHEIKGAHVWPDSVLKFDVAAGMHAGYTFRMMQGVKGHWTEIRTRKAV